MRYPKLRELKEAVKALIKGPYTSKFPYQPHKPYERFRGRSEFHEEDCVGCGACYQVCPSGAIEMQDLRDKRFLSVNWDKCIFCGSCQANCPTEKGIKLSNDFDLSTTGKREELRQEIKKELVVCECCNELIGPREQILWVARRLGPLIFSNATLTLFYLGNLGLDAEGGTPADPLRRGVAAKEKTLTKEEGELLRADRIKILCPRCRREAVLKS